jgi:hypothetical protein
MPACVARTRCGHCAHDVQGDASSGGGIEVQSSLTVLGSREESAGQGCGGESSPRWPVIDEGVVGGCMVRSCGTGGDRGVRKRPTLKGRANVGGAHRGGEEWR